MVLRTIPFLLIFLTYRMWRKRKDCPFRCLKTLEELQEEEKEKEEEEEEMEEDEEEEKE